jgi:hypothetical protein
MAELLLTTTSDGLIVDSEFSALWTSAAEAS